MDTATTTITSSTTSTKTTTTTTTVATSEAITTDNVAQPLESTRMTTAASSSSSSHYHHQTQQKQLRTEQPTDNPNFACTPKTLQTLLDIPESMELSQIELIYRAEGNANLVLGLPQFKKVLRLPKCAVNERGETKSNSPQQHTEQLKEQQPHKLTAKASATLESQDDDLTMKDFAAYMQILRQLVGNAFILEVDICRIQPEANRKWLNKHISSARPAHRLDKEFCGQFGLLLPDATLLPIEEANILPSNLQSMGTKRFSEDTYAIEIKPKQGWLLLPNSGTSYTDVNDLFDFGTAISSSPTTTTTAQPAPTTPETAPTTSKIPRRTIARCRYCAMQFLKLKHKKISMKNSYCPIDLFSGTPSRMLAALDALFRCPQNNLRVFRNGILIYGDHERTISYNELCENIFQDDSFQVVKHLVVTCLLRDYTSNKGNNTSKPETASTATVGATETFVGQPHSSMEKTNTKKLIAAGMVKPSNVIETATKMETETKAPSDEKQKKRAVPVETATLAPETTETTTKTSPATQIEINVAEMQCLPENCVLQKILHLQLLLKQNLQQMHAAGYMDHTQKSYNALKSLLKRSHPVSLEHLTPAEQYLLGATALDCSIMISFKQISLDSKNSTLDELVHLPNFKKSFLTKCTLLDLDPKPDTHFQKYIHQTKEAYIESNKF